MSTQSSDAGGDGLRVDYGTFAVILGDAGPDNKPWLRALQRALAARGVLDHADLPEAEALAVLQEAAVVLVRDWQGPAEPCAPAAVLAAFRRHPAFFLDVLARAQDLAQMRERTVAAACRRLARLVPAALNAAAGGSLLARARARAGRDVGGEGPMVPPGLALAWQAFWELDGCRTAAEAPLPWTALTAWADAHGLDQADRVLLRRLIAAMDQARAAWRQDRKVQDRSGRHHGHRREA